MKARSMRRLALCTFLIQALFLSVTVRAQDQLVAFTIQNDAQEAVCHVFISSSSDTSWGNDWLGENNVIPAETPRTWQVEVGAYDVLILDCNETRLYEQYGVDLAEDSTITLYPRSGRDSENESVSSEIVTFMIVNKSRVSICFVFLSPTTSDEWGDDWLGSSEVIRPDTSRSWEVAPGWFDLLLQDCDGNALLERYGFNLTQSTDLELIGANDETPERQHTRELNQEGVIALYAGRYDEALTRYEEALAIVRELGDREGEAALLHNIGEVYDVLGHSERALEYFHKARIISREIADRAGEGTSIISIGDAYLTVSPTLALEYYEQALSIVRELDDRLGEGVILGAIGKYYAMQGQSSSALVYLRQARAIARDFGDLFWEASAVQTIGVVYEDQGQYDRALSYYHEALALDRELRELDLRLGESSVANNIGTLYTLLGRYSLALEYFQQALAVSREMGTRRQEGITLNNFGVVYSLQGEYTLALDYHQQALAVARELGDLRTMATGANNIATLYAKQGEYTSALEYYRQALTIKVEISDVLGQGHTLNNMGDLYSLQGEYTSALEYYRQAISIRAKVGDIVGLGETLHALGNVYFVQGEYSQALGYYNDAVENTEQVIGRASLDSTLANLTGTKDLLYHNIASTHLHMGNPEMALYYSERGRAILTRDELTNSPIDFRHLLRNELLEHESELSLALINAQNVVNNLRQDSNVADQMLQSAQITLQATRDAYDNHLELMRLQGGFLDRQIAFETASVGQIQAALPPDTTLLIYDLGDVDSFVLLVSRTNLQGILLDVTLAELEELVAAFAADRRANAGSLTVLYEKIFAPIAGQITSSHVMISPDGVLNYIPFAALQDPITEHYLIDDFAISLIPSGTTLVLLDDRQSVSPSSSALVLAQPDAPGLPRLQNAQSEALRVAELLGVQANTEATETALRTEVGGTALLHISSHAELDRFAPMYSAIHLGADEFNDGRLEVREIYELDLSTTTLVVLSGCETGTGGDGEDFDLMSRSFFVAGAQGVVASLWSVDDEATSQLVTAFIRERANYSSEADALRAAMLETRANYPEPYYWASFTLTGIP